MNNQNNILLVDPNFDNSTSKSCCLLIKIDSHSFSYAIINNENNKVVALFDEQKCDGAEKLIERLKIDNNLTLPFQQVKLAFYSKNIVSVPNFLLNESDLSLHTKFFIEPNTTNLYTQKQDFFKFTNLFSLSPNANETANNYFADGIKYTDNAGLIKLAEQLEETCLVLDFSAESFKSVYLHQNNIVFQQNYEISSSEEFNYYLLLIINQLEINLGQTKVLISGIIHAEDQNYVVLKKYFSEIEFLQLGNDLNLQNINDLPAHYYTCLLALYQCE